MDLKKIIFSIFTLMLFILLSCQGEKQSSYKRLKKLDIECGDALINWKYDEADSLSGVMYLIADSINSDKYLAKSLYYKGTFRPDLPSYSLKLRENKLLQAENLAVEQGDSHLLAVIYNSKAIWQAVKHRNYPLAQYYLSKAIEYARKSGDILTEKSAEANNSEICRLLGDTLGFKYDLDLFKYAQETKNSPLLISSAYHCSKNLILTGCSLQDLLKFTEAIELADAHSSFIPLIYAEYWYSKGKYGEALNWILKTDYDKSYMESILYAKILQGLTRFNLSNEIANSIIQEYSIADYDDGWVDMYRVMASNYAGLNKYDSAYFYQHKYNALIDSIRSRRNQDKISQLKIEYEVNKKDQEIFYQKEKSNRIVVVSIISGIIFLIILFMAIIYIKKRNRLFREIVKQNREHYRAEKKLKDEIKDLNDLINQQREGINDLVSKNANNVPQPNNGMSINRVDEIFDRIKFETENNEIWRSPTVTRESFADQIGCNRTYFTEVIKIKTGMSYTQYMNQLRIKEVLKIFSNSDFTKINLKDVATNVGFTSFSNFYSIFKQSLGISPSAYLKAQNKIIKGNNSEKEAII